MLATPTALLLLVAFTATNAAELFHPAAVNCSSFDNQTCSLSKDCYACGYKNSFAVCCARNSTGGCCVDEYNPTIRALCYDVDQKCCRGYDYNGFSFLCPADKDCCGSTDQGGCCDPTKGETCCAVQYSTSCCVKGYSCCTSPNFHTAVCCNDESDICCGSDSGGGVCCDKQTQKCGPYGWGCINK